MSSRHPRFRQNLATHDGKGGYGRLVGKLVDIITTEFGNPHVRLVVNAGDAGNERYEVDVNVYSTRTSPRFPNGSNVQFAIRDEAVSDPPGEGIDRTMVLAYAELGLHQADFAAVDEDTLHDKIVDLARSAELVEIFGVIYADPDGSRGIHDVHMNSGEGGVPADPAAKDGAIAFHFSPEPGQAFQPHAQWVFIKFATQTLT